MPSGMALLEDKRVLNGSSSTGKFLLVCYHAGIDGGTWTKETLVSYLIKILTSNCSSHFWCSHNHQEAEQEVAKVE